MKAPLFRAAKISFTNIKRIIFLKISIGILTATQEMFLMIRIWYKNHSNSSQSRIAHMFKHKDTSKNRNTSDR